MPPDEQRRQSSELESGVWAMPIRSVTRLGVSSRSPF